MTALHRTGAAEQMLFARAQRRVRQHARWGASPSLPELPLPSPLLLPPPSQLPLQQQKQSMLHLLLVVLPLPLALPMLLPMLPSHR